MSGGPWVRADQEPGWTRRANTLVTGLCGRCPCMSAVSPARTPGRTDIWRTGKIIKAAIGRVIAGQGPVNGVGEAVCKTVGSAYASSNLAPATTSGNGPWPACIAARGPFARCLTLLHHVLLRGTVSQWLRTYSGRERGRASGSRHRWLGWLRGQRTPVRGVRGVPGAGCCRGSRGPANGRAIPGWCPWGLQGREAGWGSFLARRRCSGLASPRSASQAAGVPLAARLFLVVLRVTCHVPAVDPDQEIAGGHGGRQTGTRGSRVQFRNGRGPSWGFRSVGGSTPYPHIAL